MLAPSHARVALVCSAHGFGHLARQLALGQALRARGAAVEVFTAAPPEVVAETLPPTEVAVHRVAVDVGIAQPDSLTEDLDQTLALLPARCGEAAIDTLAEALRGFDRVVVDIAPAALEACRRAGVPALAVGNFDWAWVYRHYPPLSAWAERFAAWQAPHPAVRLTPGPGLHGFDRVEDMGLLGRTAPAHPLPPRSVLVSFGGFGLRDLDAALPRLPGVTWVLAPPSPPLHRPDCLHLPGVPYPALVAGADAVFTKPGYGILAEASLAGTPLCWVPRGAFPEAPSLVQAMRARGDEAVGARPGEPGFGRALVLALERLWARPRPARVHDDTARRLAARVLMRELPPAG